jgi:hypothetical protein
VAYTVGSGTLVHAVCEGIIILRHGPQEGDSRTRKLLAQGVGAAVLIGTTAAAARTKDSTGTSTSDKRADDIEELLRQQIAAFGATFDSLEKTTLSRRGLAPGMMETISIKGMAHGDESLSWDHLLTRYDDGTGHVISTVAPDNINGTISKTKRHDGMGFKYNWRRFDVNPNFLGSPDLSVLPDLAAAVSSDWAIRYDDDHIDEYIFTGGVDRFYTFGMRIIAETNSFGEEFEDVNICGDLGGIAHDELRRV